MSKSLGTGVDPMTLIEKYGADATRFGLIWQAMGGQDIKWAEEHVIAGKKFCNKIWNASRFVITQIEKSKSQNPNSKQIKVITAWRYPGKSPVRDPIPAEILKEVRLLI